MVPLDSGRVIFSFEDSFTKQDERPGKNDVIGRSPFLPYVIEGLPSLSNFYYGNTMQVPQSIISTRVSSNPSKLGQHFIHNKRPMITRCAIHNGPAINLISTIELYDKLVITRGKIKNKSILMYIIMLL
jgi:hypothetical protein